MDLDPSGSWEERIDHCLGQAGRVLQVATDHFFEGITDDTEAGIAAMLSEAWKELAEHWEERQIHELRLTEAMADDDDDDDEDDEDEDDADRVVRVREIGEG